MSALQVGLPFLDASDLSRPWAEHGANSDPEDFSIDTALI